MSKLIFSSAHFFNRLIANTSKNTFFQVESPVYIKMKVCENKKNNEKPKIIEIGIFLYINKACYYVHKILRNLQQLIYVYIEGF